MAVGAIMWMKSMTLGGMHAGPVLFGAGFIGVLYTMIAWWSDVINEAEHGGYHTRVVQISHRYGMIMFIASEVMFFVAWFWAYFDASLFAARGHQLPRARGARRRSGRRRASPSSIPSTCRCSTR